MWFTLACTPVVLDLPDPPDSVSDSVEPAASALVLSVAPPPGVLVDPLTVQLDSTVDGAVIRFTLDGTSPLEGEVYEGPVSLGGLRGAVRLRAVASDGELSSEELDASYVVVPSVLSQSAELPGFPAAWGVSSVIDADYEMDPEVLEDEDARARAEAGLGSLPALAIWMDPEDLFGPEGIYDNADLEGIAWERPAAAHWLEPNGEGFAVDCGIRVQGGSSTGNWKVPKVSLRLLFKRDYGPGTLEFPLFGEGVDRFNTLVLDAHMNNTWIHPGADQQARGQYVRDPFIADLQRAVGGHAPRTRFTNVFLNGAYWGVFDVHERPDDAWAAELLGGEREDYDVLRHSASNVVSGDADAWNEVLNLVRSGAGDEQVYAQLQALVNEENLADYMLVNFVGGNTDWPHHNWYVARRRDGGQWHFISWDAEHVLESVNADVTGRGDAGSPGEIFVGMMANEGFRAVFAERAELHLGSAGALGPAALAEAYSARIDQLDDAIVLESARWGDYRRELPYTREGEWLDHLAWIEGEVLPARSALVSDQLRSRGYVD